VGGAAEAYEALDEPWRLAIEEAWTSWRAGCAGVGAVISDADGGIVAVGRNRMIEPRTEPGLLASTPIAHGEMNALALLPLGPTDGLVLTTTFEPCLMCATTIVQARIPVVRYAAADPVFAGLQDWFAELPFARDRIPARTELGGPLGAFCHVLHVSWMAFWVRDGAVMAAHEELRPRHLAVAREVAEQGGLAAVAEQGGTVVDAVDALWPTLVELAAS